MTRRWQYPEFVEPEFTGPEQTFLDKWWQPFAQPVRRVSFAAALIASGSLIDPEPVSAVEDVTVDKWLVSLCEPVLPLHKIEPGESLIDADQLLQPEVTTLDKWYVAFSEPVLPPERVPEFPAYADQPDRSFISETGPGPEQIEWFTELSLPVLPPGQVPEFPAFASPEIAVLDLGIWTKQTGNATSWSDAAPGSTTWSKQTGSSTTWSDV